MLLKQCYQGTVPEVMASMWFQSLQTSDQEEVQGVVGYSLDLCLFHLLNILDGTSPVQPMEQPSDFAVYLQTHASDEDLEHSKPSTTVRVNPWSPTHENGAEQLHDIFSELMEDALEG